MIIQGNTLQWNHFDYAAPGRLDGVNYPTIITTTLNGVTQMNGVDWIPTWPLPPPDPIRFPAMSSVFTGLTPAIPDTTDVTLTVITARDSLTIAQLPTASNDFTTLLEFNDDPSAGAAWYEGLLTFGSGSSTAYGGGIANGGTLTVVNSTIADNTVASGGSGGGLGLDGGTATLDNTIVALNTEGTGSGATPDDIAGTVSSTSAYNLIGTGGSGGLVNGVNGNQVGVADPGLDPNGLQTTAGRPRPSPSCPAAPPSTPAATPWPSIPPPGSPWSTTSVARDSHGSSTAPSTSAPSKSKATAFVVTTQPPASVTAGSDFGLTVTAEDSSGNVDTSFNGTVTVALANNPGGATLGGTLTVTAQDGVATFSDLTLNKAGTGYTLLVSASGLAGATTDAFDVTPAAATQLVVTSQPPSNVIAGSHVRPDRRGRRSVRQRGYQLRRQRDRGTVVQTPAVPPSAAR